MNAAVALVVLAVVAIASRRVRSWTWCPTRLAALLEGRWAPPLAAFLTFVIVRVVWGSFAEPGVIHDERAYLLQAEIFARGRWTAPAPPIAAFFEQMHVFVDPAVFAKYPPAHALLLVPGIWLGMPGLMPALLAGLAGGLTFWIARRLAGIWIAALTWMLWTTAPATLMWATSYLSESSSTVFWLSAAAATLLWLDSGRTRDLTCVAAALALGFATRPLTMLALALPLAFVIGRRLLRPRDWRSLAAPALTSVVLLSLSPIWNQQTLGSWRLDPYPHYSRTYFPFDKPGFGVDPTPPLREIPRELSAMGMLSRDVHAAYVASTVPSAFTERLVAFVISCAEGWRMTIALLLVAALVRPDGPTRFCLAITFSLFAAYLAFAHPPAWVVYYFELLPAVHFLAASGLVRLVARTAAESADLAARLTPVTARASAVTALVVLPLCAGDLVRARAGVDERNGFHRQAEAVIRGVPANSVVFVRYPSTHNPNLAITRNEADQAAARSWIVYDRGLENDLLLSVAPERQPYLLDVSTWRLEPLTARHTTLATRR
jgi:hypothetical protein